MGVEQITQWDTRYAGEDYVFGTAPNAFLAAQARRLRPGWKALAIADGEGRNGVWLAGQGLAVTSLDASRTAQEKAQRLAEARGVE
ncbi:MAG TPA: SAM-dependent methyltransferase, partial [Caulobacteraceae bacterium]|nr:SAM-dependent methyltransferase [Caulobacteraceae bacterium]